MPSRHQIFAASTAVFALLGYSPESAQAFWDGFGGSDRTISAPAQNVPAQARRAVSPRSAHRSAIRQEPTPNDLAAKATGLLQVVVSIDKQQLTLYSDGQVVARSRVSTGMRGHATPTGVFSIIEKDRWHRSNIYDDAPMYYMQRITWSGVALHQGVVPNYAASHGCIRMPEAFAKQMWRTTRLGARVIVSHGDVAPVPFAHPKLFTVKHAPQIAQAQSLQVRSLQVRSFQAQSLQVRSLMAAEQAWTFARLASQTPLVGATLTDAPDLPAMDKPKLITRPLKAGPVSVFISRKEGRLYVRKGFEPVFDVPVSIDQRDAPLGTHVFTAMAANDDSTMNWTVISMAHAAEGSPASAAGALDRITIPQDARDAISELLTTGASLIVSDQGLGSETGRGTDFVVLTR